MPPLGSLLLMAAFAFGLAGTFGFFRAARGYQRCVNWARASYICSSILIVCGCGLLIYYLVKGDFSYYYVYKYSSSQSSLLYLISAFWAGQQGTYLLWLLFLSLLGYFLICSTERYANWAMVFYGLIISFFGFVLIVLSPFARVFPPYQEGAGLNPLLQDPWMAIHPPIIFLGYAVAALPCVLALASLIKKDYDSWTKYAFPGAVLTALLLGAGNIMGGFWAYKTLGWGGYWAWDPVENSSFIPWMLSLSLVHGLLIERKKQALRRTNLLVAILIFLLIIYGTFLTRSGILQKFSVHSFTSLGVNHYLISFMVGFALLSLTVYFWRLKTAKTKPGQVDILSKETALIVSVWLLILIAAIVLIGTSWPLLTGIVGHPSALEIGFYTNVTLPLAILIGIGAGFAPLLAWGKNHPKRILRQTILLFTVSGGTAFVSMCLGIRGATHLILVFAASFAMYPNLKALILYFNKNWLFAGALVSHFGLGLMLVGILISSAYTVDKQLSLEQGKSVTAFGSNVSYRGMTSTVSSPQNKIILEINKGDIRFEARPAFFVFKKMGLIAKPYIWRSLFYDRYFSPQQIIVDSATETAKIGRNETAQLKNFEFAFDGFEVDQEKHDDSTTSFGAFITVHDETGHMEKLTPAMVLSLDGNTLYQDALIANGTDSFRVRLDKIFADEEAILLSVKKVAGPPRNEQLILDISLKPAMNAVWGGAILLLLGLLLLFIGSLKKLTLK